MAYATAANVRAEFKSLPSGSSSIMDDTRIESLVAQADAFIDGMVGRVYTVPVVEVDSPNSFLVLKQISTFLTADRIKDILEIKDSPVPEGNQQVRGMTLSGTAMSMLKKIVSKELILSDATLVNAHQGMASFNSDNAIENFFEIGTDQW